MLQAEGLEYEFHGDGEEVLLIHGGHIADAFLPGDKPDVARESALPVRVVLVQSAGAP